MAAIVNPTAMGDVVFRIPPIDAPLLALSNGAIALDARVRVRSVVG